MPKRLAIAHWHLLRLDCSLFDQWNLWTNSIVSLARNLTLLCLSIDSRENDLFLDEVGSRILTKASVTTLWLGRTAETPLAGREFFLKHDLLEEGQ